MRNLAEAHWAIRLILNLQTWYLPLICRERRTTLILQSLTKKRQLLTTKRKLKSTVQQFPPRTSTLIRYQKQTKMMCELIRASYRISVFKNTTGTISSLVNKCWIRARRRSLLPNNSWATLSLIIFKDWKRSANANCKKQERRCMVRMVKISSTWKLTLGTHPSIRKVIEAKCLNRQ